jgi:hypothetical protein
MKKTLFLSMLISLAMICSCQKQDSAAEAQLAQRKTELDVREEAVVEREKAVEQREKAVAEREKAIASARTIPAGVPRQTPDPAQVKAERDKRLQQLPPEFRALISRTPSDISRAEAEKSEKMSRLQERGVRTQPSLEDSAKKKMSAIAAPAVPEADANSASASPTPE